MPTKLKEQKSKKSKNAVSTSEVEATEEVQSNKLSEENMAEQKKPKKKFNIFANRKKRPSKKQKQIIQQLKDNDDEQIEEQEKQSKQTASQAAASEINSFFYTNDKFLNQFDDDEIVEYVQFRFPMLMKLGADIQTQKKQFVEMLSDAKYMQDFLQRFDMLIYDFFKIVYKYEPDLFKGSYLKKIQKAMKYKKYATNAKKVSFLERRRTRLKELNKTRKTPGGRK